MTEEHQTQIRMTALNEAIRAHGGTGMQAADIISAAEQYVAFVLGQPAKRQTARTQKKKAR